MVIQYKYMYIFTAIPVLENTCISCLIRVAVSSSCAVVTDLYNKFCLALIGVLVLICSRSVLFPYIMFY